MDVLKPTPDTPNESQGSPKLEGTPQTAESPTLGRFELDIDSRRSGQGRTLLGGTPFRLLRFSGDGANLIDQIADGKPLPASPPNRALVEQLVEAGLIHPIVAPRNPRVDEVTVVIPVFGDPDGLANALDALSEAHHALPVLVVDDASDPADGELIAHIVDGHDNVQLHRLPTNQGPAAARNVGWKLAGTPLIAFLDADVEARNWLAPILGHFDDSIVAAVAPRVGAPNPQLARVPGTVKPVSALSRYERARSPLDMGLRRSRVAPGHRVSYAPAAALVVRRSALAEIGGFDESLRFGEDVDLLWRLDAVGHRIRYEPLARVTHRNRATWEQLVYQRMSYGASAADLDDRHPGNVAPVELNAQTAASWLLIALGGAKGAAVGVGLAAHGATRLRGAIRNNVDEPTAEARALAIQSHMSAGRWLAAAVTRTWLPLAVVGSVFSRRVRYATAAAVVAPATADWVNTSPDLDLVRWTGARLLDDASYCAGVWKGVLRNRSARVLVPKINRSPSDRG